MDKGDKWAETDVFRPISCMIAIVRSEEGHMKSLAMMSLVVAGAAFATQACAQELSGTLKKVKDTGTITIGYRDSSIPFSYLDDNQ